MKIGIDVQTTLGQKSGFGFYVKNLVENLKKVDSINEYFLISPEDQKDFTTPQRFVWDQCSFPSKASKLNVDILHQPCFSAPLFYSGKIILTIHDLISHYFPQNMPSGSRLYFSKWMPLTYNRAAKIIAISENTKRDIMSLLKIPEEKIVVIHSAVGDEFKPINDAQKLAEIKAKYKTSDKFILDVGTLEPRKNLPFLVKAYHEALKTGKIEHNLVLTGKKGWYYESLFDLIKELKLEDKVILPGYVPDEDLPGLYNAADLFCFPSLYEGFGFPPLEALSCGTPVIAADNSSIPEVVGDAGILLPIDKEKVWAENIIKVLTDKDLHEKLSLSGLEQAKKFSWAKTARETVKVYEEVGKKR
ncbi:MAG: glycosyltransferase family 1 protein [Candidatus Berkelbacteria bacterium]